MQEPPVWALIIPVNAKSGVRWLAKPDCNDSTGGPAWPPDSQDAVGEPVLVQVCEGVKAGSAARFDRILFGFTLMARLHWDNPVNTNAQAPQS